MSVPSEAGGQPISGKAELVTALESGCKPKDTWRIGTEHEKFVFYTDTLQPVSYEGANGIGAILDRLRTVYGWQGVYEGETLIGLSAPKGSLPGGPLSGSISLEPGGQFELSGAPLLSLHQTCSEAGEHLSQVRAVTRDLGVGMIGLGFRPNVARADVPWMPKGRYAIMRRYMPTKGGLGLDMMLRTATVQVNLDFASEADMALKMRTSLALQPIATALFANSPFTEGRPNGYRSMRSAVWMDTDPDRSGMLPFAFEDGFGFERYVDYALDVPMYFVYRGGRYIDVAGQSFRDFLAGKLPGLPGILPTMADWADHLTTIFPEVRLKTFLEMRGADAGSWDGICALPAFWVGLLYDGAALAAAWDVCRDWTAQERQHLRDTVPTQGLEARIAGRSVREIARELLAIAEGGLRARNRRDHLDVDETPYLGSLHRTVAQGRSPADELLALYHGPWGQRLEPLFHDYAY